MSFLSTPLMRLAMIALASVPLIWHSSVALSTVVTLKQIQCAYNPDSGQPNPFGSRAFITVTQNGADTTFRYESFPSLVQMPDQENVHKPRAVTLENTRTMIFYNTQIEVAREVMRVRRDYFYELIGYKDEVGFSAYDEAMSCE